MSYFLCPACKKPLNKEDRSYTCENGHCYDISKSGYINLLLNPAKNSNSPGDNKLMVNARRDFLNKGYYSRLSDAVSNTVLEYLPSYNLPILDVGCGEGYYTENIAEKLCQNNIENDIVGIDISKFALDKAAKRCKKSEFAVASIFHMPFKDNFCCMLINIFAPFFKDEFIRTLSKGGIFIMVIPGEEHLWELKNVLYDFPYKNEVKGYDIDGFELLDVKKVKYSIDVENSSDLQNLFKMTPYYYKSPIEASKKLEKLNSLNIQLDFQILIYKKI